MTTEGKIVALGCVIILATTLALAYFFGSVSCSIKWSDYETDFGMFSGCRVRIDGKFIPAENVRGI